MASARYINFVTRDFVARPLSDRSDPPGDGQAGERLSRPGWQGEGFRYWGLSKAFEKTAEQQG